MTQRTEVFTTCGHCGNKGICAVRAAYDDFDPFRDEYPDMIWYLLQCPACEKIILLQSLQESSKSDPWEVIDRVFIQNRAFIPINLYLKLFKKSLRQH